jgi:uncharacterized protein (TIGR02246 family)
MRKLLIVIPLVFLLCFTFSCQKGEEVAEKGITEEEVNAINKEVLETITESWAKHVEAAKRQDAVGAAAIFADDVWWIGEDGLEVKSRKELETMYSQMYKSGMLIKEQNYITEELTVSNDIAVQMGWFTMTIESQGQEDKSKYNIMVAWQRQQDGSWKVYRGMGISVKESK